MKSTCDCKVTNKQCFIVNYETNKALIKFKESGLIFYGDIEKKSIKKGLLINYNDNVIYEGGFNANAMKDDDNCCLMEFNNGRLFYGKCKEDMLMQGKMLVIDKKSFEKERVVVNEMFQFERKGKDIKFVDEDKIAKMSDNYYENIASYGVKKLKMFQKVIKARKEVEKMIKKYESNSKWKEEEVERDLKRIEDLFKEDKYEFEVCKKTKIDEGLMENMGSENKVSNMESKGEEVLECKEDISSLSSLDKDNKDVGIESEVIVDSNEQKEKMGVINEENVKGEQIQNEGSKQQIDTEEDKDKFSQNELGSEKQKEDISSSDLDNKLPEEQLRAVSPIEDKETGKDIITITDDVKEVIVEPKDNEIKEDKKEDKREENKELEIKENKDAQLKYVDDDKKDKEDDISIQKEEETKEKIIPSSNEKEEINQAPSDRVITNEDKEDNIPLNETSPEETITTPIEQKEIISNENQEEQIPIDESKEETNKVEDNNIHIELPQEKENIIIDTQPQIDNKIKESKDITEQEINNPEIEPSKDNIEQSVSLTEDKPITDEDKKEENIIEEPTKQSNDEIIENKDSQSDKSNKDTNTIKDEQLSNETQNEQIEDKTAEPKEIIKDSSDIQTQNKEDIPNTQEEVQGDNIIESNKPKDEPILITQKEEEKKQQENILPDISKDTSINQEEKIKDTPQIEQSDIQLKENEEIIESTPTKTLIEEEKDNDDKQQELDLSNKDDDDIQPLKKEDKDNSLEIVDEHTPTEKKEPIVDDKPISEHTQEENTPTETIKDKEDETIQLSVENALSEIKEIPTISSDKEVETVHKENLAINQNQLEELHEETIGVPFSKEEINLNDNNKEEKEEPIITNIQQKEDSQTKEEPLSTISNDNALQEEPKKVESLQSKDISLPKDDVIKEETPLNEVTEQTDSEKEKQIDDDKEKLKESPLIKEEIVLDKHNKETDKDNIIQDNDKINSLEDIKKT